MSKLLYIKANPKLEGDSRTFDISDEFINEYAKVNPDDKIEIVDLYVEGIDFLREEDLKFHSINSDNKNGSEILQYANQFVNADKFVISAPFWNLSIPAILKAYIDYICIPNIAFKYTESGVVGLCNNKKAVHIVTRGGEYSQGPAKDYEMGDRYLKTIFTFLGITDFTTIAAEKLDIYGIDKQEILNKAKEKAIEIAKIF